MKKKLRSDFDFEKTAKLAAIQLGEHFGIKAKKVPLQQEMWCYSIASSGVNGNTPEERANHFVDDWLSKHSSNGKTVVGVFWHTPDLVFVDH